jgi:hypothetical protein
MFFTEICFEYIDDNGIDVYYFFINHKYTFINCFNANFDYYY